MGNAVVIISGRCGSNIQSTGNSRWATLCVAVVSLLLANCGVPSGGNEAVARNCRFAAEGEKLFDRYSRVLRVAKDWEKVGWLRQVPVTKWMACKHNLGSHAPD